MTAITKYNAAEITAVEYFGDNVIQAFVESRHGSANSQRTYRNAVKRLVVFFAEKGITAPTTADVDAFINSLRTEGKAAATIRLYVTVTKLFFAFLEKKGIYRDVAVESEKLRLKKQNVHSKSALSNAQAKALLASITGTDEKNLRDKAIVALCLTCGLRTVEVERANVEDLTDEGGYYKLLLQGKGCTCKGEGNQFAKVMPVVAKMIFAYLAVRGSALKDNLYSKKDGDKDGAPRVMATPLFTSTARNASSGRRFSAQGTSKMIKARLKSIGVNSPKITAHSTRHYYAQTALDSGVSLRDVSAGCRHASLNVTLIYLEDIALRDRQTEMAVADSLFGGVA